MKFNYLGLMIVVLLWSCEHQKKEITVDWILVQGGTFVQGENQIIISSKGDTVRGFTSPFREVRLRDFYIAKYEVTVKQFKEFCRQMNRPMPRPPLTTAFGDTIDYQWQDEYPMLATWDEANEFARWAGGRLPTEAEWEYAAKGGSKSKSFSYSGSNDAREVGWVRENADSSLHPVGLLAANELGIHDMTGNISEWVSDWYNPPMDQMSEIDNPTGPLPGIDSMKISKGLSWFYGSVDEKTLLPLPFGIHMPEVRYQSPIDTRNDGFGFRIAKDL